MPSAGANVGPPFGPQYFGDNQGSAGAWFEGYNNGSFKKSTIVAMARKLLVALWKYVTAGVVIEGAIMKNA